MIIPAIDLMGGNAVRLKKGIKESVQVIGPPIPLVNHFVECGVKLLHVVDLDGAFEESPQQVELIQQISKLIPIQIGGGIRSLEQAQKYNATRVVLGTLAFENPSEVQRIIDAGIEVVIAIDIKDGKPAIKGWVETVEESLSVVIKRFCDMGVQRFLCTSVSQDGMMSGPDLKLYKDLSGFHPDIDLIASGGVRDHSDINCCLMAGCREVIVGKGFYEGNINFNLDFFSTNLIPTILQEEGTGKVLTLAYSHQKSISLMRQTNEVWLWSRTRGLWYKGATSGNTQKVHSMHWDCDRDALLVKVTPSGPACHTGTKTCFEENPATILQEWDRVFAESGKRGNSYTKKVMSDQNFLVKKLGEEQAEFLQALLVQDPEQALNEACDLIYFVGVALATRGVSMEDVLRCLQKRHTE